MTASFDWDPAKDAANQCKHGVSFVEAQRAFLDPERLLALDAAHSQHERRFLLWQGGWQGAHRAIHLPNRGYPHHRRRLLATGQKVV